MSESDKPPIQTQEQHDDVLGDVLIPRSNGDIAKGRLTGDVDEFGRRIAAFYDEQTGSYSYKALSLATLSEAQQMEFARELAASKPEVDPEDEVTLPRGVGRSALSGSVLPAEAVSADRTEGNESQRLTEVTDHMRRRADLIHAEAGQDKAIGLDSEARRVVEDLTAGDGTHGLGDSMKILGVATGVMSQPRERNALYDLLARELGSNGLKELDELYVHTNAHLGRAVDADIESRIQALENWRQRLVEQGRPDESITKLVRAARLGLALKLSDPDTRNGYADRARRDLLNGM